MVRNHPCLFWGSDYDYQLSNAQQNLGDMVFGLKITLLSWTTFLISKGDNIKTCVLPTILRALLLIMSNANKLPLEREPVASDNNRILMLQQDYQTFILPYSTDNHRILPIEACCSANLKFRTLK